MIEYDKALRANTSARRLQTAAYITGSITLLGIAGAMLANRMRHDPASPSPLPSPSATRVPDCYSSQWEPRYKGETPDATGFQLKGTVRSENPLTYSCRFLGEDGTVLDVLGTDKDGDGKISTDERFVFVNGTPFHPDLTTR